MAQAKLGGENNVRLAPASDMRRRCEGPQNPDFTRPQPDDRAAGRVQPIIHQDRKK